MLRAPFTAEQFFDVFREYNEAVWPTQLALTAFAVLIAVLLARRAPTAGSWSRIVLGAFWLWMGAVYHLSFFVTINTAATAFGIALAIAAGIFLLRRR